MTGPQSFSMNATILILSLMLHLFLNINVYKSEVKLCADLESENIV